MSDLHTLYMKYDYVDDQNHAPFEAFVEGLCMRLAYALQEVELRGRPKSRSTGSPNKRAV